MNSFRIKLWAALAAVMTIAGVVFAGYSSVTPTAYADSGDDPDRVQLQAIRRGTKLDYRIIVRNLSQHTLKNVIVRLSNGNSKTYSKLLPNQMVMFYTSELMWFQASRGFVGVYLGSNTMTPIAMRAMV